MTPARRYTNRVRCLAFYALTSVGSAPALAADCANWDVSGEWGAQQSRGTQAWWILKQDSTNFSGQARFAKGASLTIGPAVGTVKGNAFEMTVYWADDSIGVYTGQIGPQGLIVGRTYDKNNPRNAADWHSSVTMKCHFGAPAGLGTTGTPKALQLGRVAPRETLPGMAICDAAKSARARNSPNAAGLEARCETQTAQNALSGMGGGATAPSLKVQNPLAIGAPSMSPVDRAQPTVAVGPAGAPHPVMDEAWRSKNLAAGAETASRDPRAKELFDLMPKGRVHDGFAIGMSVVGGDTADGPGKQAIRNALAPDEQKGYDMAHAYALPRNLRADYALRGMTISTMDSALVQHRNSRAAASAAATHAPEAAVFYKLGFDIGVGLNDALAGGSPSNPAVGARIAVARGPLSGSSLTGFDEALNFMRSRGR